uniref:Fat storage-inducing transmembrane protein 2-like n=1 Tax=Phallusia mammillata TaxID=59560 RepID=A0A6F9DDM7_9ASCI|nr:fat storage-inducing transmembrane protein 2-like [Phallusia mammillata]
MSHRYSHSYLTCGLCIFITDISFSSLVIVLLQLHELGKMVVHNRQNATQNDKDIASEPSRLETITRFIVESRYYSIPVSFKVVGLWFFVLIISAITLVVDVRPTYFSHKRNFFNVYLVKFAWGWTLVVTGLYSIVVSFVHGCELWKKTITSSILRLAVGTFVWYLWVNVVFHFIENLTGVCIGKDRTPNLSVGSKLDCIQLKQGYIWEAVDISGHCFLLTYSILFMKSELDLQRNWHKIPIHGAQFRAIGSKSLTNLKSRYKLTLPLVHILFLVNILLGALWEFMLLATCVYFHSFLSKAAGAAIGIFSWLVTYNEWYRCKFPLSIPGHGPLGDLFVKNTKKTE